jgi:hypothetical protein
LPKGKGDRSTKRYREGEDVQQACDVTGYDGQTMQAVTHVIFLDLSINGRRLMDTPFFSNHRLGTTSDHPRKKMDRGS